MTAKKIYQYENIGFSIVGLINSDIPISSDNITFALFHDGHVVATQVANIPHMKVYNKVTGADIHVNDQTVDKRPGAGAGNAAYSRQTSSFLKSNNSNTTSNRLH